MNQSRIERMTGLLYFSAIVRRILAYHTISFRSCKNLHESTNLFTSHLPSLCTNTSRVVPEGVFTVPSNKARARLERTHKNTIKLMTHKRELGTQFQFLKMPGKARGRVFLRGRVRLMESWLNSPCEGAEEGRGNWPRGGVRYSKGKGHIVDKLVMR